MPDAMSGKRVPSRELFDLVAGHFRVLGEPARLALLHSLADGERSAASLLAETKISQANLSKHMTVLCQAGFVTRRREGPYVHYQLADARVLSLCELMCDRLESDAISAHELIATRMLQED